MCNETRITSLLSYLCLKHETLFQANLTTFVTNRLHCSHKWFVDTMFDTEMVFAQAPLYTATAGWRGPFPLGWGGLAANMPTVGVKRDLLFKALGRTYSKSHSLHIQITDKWSAGLLNVILALKDRKTECCLSSLAWWLATQQLLTSG